jgi:hypothetical protein
MKRALLTTEAIMKKVAFVFILFFALFVVSNSILAKTNSEYAEALKYYNSGKYEEAVRLLKEYVKKEPEPVAYYRLGYALYELKKYDEANEYFKEAYLINPEISPSPIEFLQKLQGSKTTGITGTAVGDPLPAEKPPVTESKIKQPELKQEGLIQPQVPAVTPQQPQEPAVTAVEPVPPPALPQVEPQQEFQTPPGFPPMPIPEQEMEMPFPMPGGMGKIIAVLIPFMVFIGIAMIVLQILWVVSHYLIAKKLNVTAAWIAFLAFSPIILSVLGLISGPEALASMQFLFVFLSIIILLATYVGYFWPVVGSAGKPWWWMLLPIPLGIVSVLLMFLPIIGFIIALFLSTAFYVYLYMCITENLGRNKWLALLMLIPFINIIFVAILAFSKSESVTADTYGDMETA